MRFLSHALAAAGGAALVAVLWLLLAPAPEPPSGLSPGQTKAVDSLIAKYFEDHPEAVGLALDRLQTRQKAAAAQQQLDAIKSHADAILHDPDDLVLGNPQGDVTVVEFFDYRCPYCKRAAPDVMETLREDGKVRLVLKEFPILGPNSVLATRAAIASVRQGKYPAFHEALLSSKSALDEGTIMALAGSVGLDTGRLAEDMKDPAIGALIEKNYRLAEALKIEGTPAFIIGERLVPGAIDKPTLQRYIQEARTKG